MRRRQRTFLLLAGGLGVLVAAPAEAALHPELEGPTPYGGNVGAAGGPVIADLEITRSRSQPYIGNDVYSTTGAGQTITKTAAAGDKKRFRTRVGNDGVSGQNIVLGNGNAENSCFRVRYVFAGSNLTHITRGGVGFLEAPMPPQPLGELTIKVKVRRCALRGFSHDATLDVGPSQGIPFDRVVARVNVV